MKKGIISNNPKGIIDGDVTAFYEIVKPQPVIDEESGFVFCGSHKKSYKNDIHHPDWKIKFIVDHCHYPLHTKLFIRERWMTSPNGYMNHYGQIINNGYKYYGTESEQFKEEWNGCWHSATQMPYQAARIWVKIIKVTMCRMQEISIQQVDRIFPKMDRIEQMQAFHKKNRDIWEINPHIFIYNFILLDFQETEK